MNNISYDGIIYNSFSVQGDKVLIKKLEETDLRKRGDIYIPELIENKNKKIGIGKIIDVSKETSEKYGVEKNTYVLYDYYSAYGDWADHVITNAENLILSVSEEEAFKFIQGGLN